MDNGPEAQVGQGPRRDNWKPVFPGAQWDRDGKTLGKYGQLLSHVAMKEIYSDGKSRLSPQLFNAIYARGYIDGLDGLYQKDDWQDARKVDERSDAQEQATSKPGVFQRSLERAINWAGIDSSANQPDYVLANRLIDAPSLQPYRKHPEIEFGAFDGEKDESRVEVPKYSVLDSDQGGFDLLKLHGPVMDGRVTWRRIAHYITRADAYSTLKLLLEGED